MKTLLHIKFNEQTKLYSVIHSETKECIFEHSKKIKCESFIYVKTQCGEYIED